MSIMIRIGPAATARANFVAESALPVGTDVSGAWEMVDTQDGAVTPAQLDDVTGAPRMSWRSEERRVGKEC